ncbi:MAG: transcription factor S [DPANN group archaeon]|nr:transcription factor S [DPANN group archaeon]
MKFCPKCGSMMKHHDNNFVCACGHKEAVAGKVEFREVKAGQLKARVQKQETKDERQNTESRDTMPVVDNVCPKCGNPKAYWWEMQTRAADEAATQFFRCTKCNHTWRKY